MSQKNARSDLIVRRGELLAELFFQDLGADFVFRSTSKDFGYDHLVGFTNSQKGVNTFAVQVEATEGPVPPRFRISREPFKRLTHSNLPGLLLVVDVKQNHLYYAWLRPGPRVETEGSSVSVPLVEIDDAEKGRLLQQFRSVTSAGTAAVG